MDQELQEIYDAANLEIELNHKVGINHQYLIEEAIMNIAALNSLSKSTEEILGKLAMTDEQAKNVLLDFCKERLNLVKLFRWNASMKHGVPIDDTSKMTVNSVENKPTIVENKSTIEASSVTTTENPFIKFLKAYAVISTFFVVLLSGLGITYLIYNKPLSQTNSVVTPENKEDSAYQWLEDKGEHIYE